MLDPTLNPAPLDGALDDEIIRLERTLAAAGLLMSGVGVLLASYTALAIAAPLGLALLGFALVLGAWFLVVRACLANGVGAGVFPWVNPFVEISIPTVLVLIDIRTQGALYAAASPVPIQFYAIFLLGSVLRLKRMLPLWVGLAGATEYLLVYLTLIRPHLHGDVLDNPAFRPDMMLMRSVVIALGGAVGAVVNATLRRAVGTAQRQWRANELFGKYRLQNLLAEGGMGSVHKALYCPEGGFEKPVALKRIHPSFAQRVEFVDAFRNEAELCSRLTHPNIVQVIDFGRVADTYFLAMEFVDGMTLAELMRRCLAAHQLPPPRLVALIGHELCQALQYAHHGARDVEGKRLRVVHRDLNPPNVLLSRTGQVKISDFGIARALGEARQDMTGSQVGKAAYLAPEQVAESAVDERCDLFALGIILWELLSLRRLFHRTTEAASMKAVMDAPIPPPTSLRQDLSPEWDGFFITALARDRDRRFRSADAMAEALMRILILEGMPTPDALEHFMAQVPAVAGPGAIDKTVETRE